MARKPGPPEAGPLTGPIYTDHSDPLNTTQEIRALWARINQVAAASPSPKPPPEPPPPPPPPPPPIGGLKMWSLLWVKRAFPPHDPWVETLPILRFEAGTNYVFLEARCRMHFTLAGDPEVGPTWEIVGTNKRRGYNRFLVTDPWPVLDPASFVLPQRLPSMGRELSPYPGAHDDNHLVGFHSPRFIDGGAYGEYEQTDYLGGASMGPDMYLVNICPQGDTVNIVLRKGEFDPCFLAVFYGYYFTTTMVPSFTRDNMDGKGPACPIW